MSTNGYFTHFTTILVLHGLLFFASWQVIQPESSLLSKVTGGVLNLRVSQITTRHADSVKPANKAKAFTPKVEQAKKNESATVSESTPAFAGSAVEAGLTDLYKAELRAKIDQNKHYPVMSRRLGQTGVVVVAFTLLEDGNIVNVRIDQPSLYERLNNSALEAVKKVERFRPIPKEIGQAKMEIKVPLKFLTI